MTSYAPQTRRSRTPAFAGVGLFFLISCFSPFAHARKMEDESIAVLRMIDKLSARTSTFEVPVEKTVKFGSRLFIKVRACRKASQLETPESAAFLQIWEKPPGSEESRWIFSGWMFASRPSASAMDSPVYDVWVIECKSAATAAAPLTTEAAPASAPDKPAAEKPATESEGGKDAPAASAPPEEEEDTEAAPGPDDSDTAPVPDVKPAPETPAMPAPQDKKTETPPPAKVFDPAVIRRDLEENAGGGTSDGEDAIAAPEEEEKPKN
jgi:hypothetical protein